MKGTTHLAAGFALAGILQQNIANPLVAVGVILGSILPDIDNHTSTIGKSIPIIPRLLKHRGVTHSPLFAIAFYFISPYLAIGIGLHIAMDFLNPEGVPLFWPIQKHIRFPIISKVFPSGGMGDSVLGAVFWILSLFVYFCLFTNRPIIPLIETAVQRLTILF